MANRIFNLLQKCCLQTLSYPQLALEPLCTRKMSLHYLTTVLKYSTSNPLQSNKKNCVNECENSPSDEVENEKKSKYILLQEKGFLPIYKFQYAPLFAAINKVKWQQLYLTSGSVPVAIFCSSVGVLPTSVPFIVLLIGGVITSTLWIFGAIFSRVVGAILISPDSKTVCISYVDNKGRRKDDVFPIKDVIPFSDMPQQKFATSWWVLLQRYAEPDHDGESRYEPYKMFVQNCTVPDKKRFMEAFGSLL